MDPPEGVDRWKNIDGISEQKIVASCLCRVRCRDFVTAKVYAGIVDDKTICGILPQAFRRELNVIAGQIIGAY